MAPEDIAKLVSNHPTLLLVLAILLTVGYALKILSQASETISALLGPVGKHWREKGNRVARRAEARRREDNEVIEDLRRRLEYFVDQVKELKAHADEKAGAYELKDDYLTYDAEWHATNEIHAAEQGYEFPPPKHMTFNEFRRRRAGWSD